MEIQIENAEISKPADFEITEFEANIQDIKEDMVDQPEVNFNPDIESVDLEIPMIKITLPVTFLASPFLKQGSEYHRTQNRILII